MIKTLNLAVDGQGLHDITGAVKQALAAASIEDGLCTLFIQENYDPSAKHDLENWLNRLVPENDPLYTHTLEGPDDMPAHRKAALTASSLSVPVVNGQLALGTWQGLFLWEHRYHCGDRKVLMHILSD